MHLFNVDDGTEKLDKDTVHLFHHLVTKLLYLSRRSRQDIQTAVAFLYTRVQSPDMDDYKKLTSVMKYICNTRDITLTMEAGDGPKWWVDSSYAVHLDMRSHSGIFMSLGKDTASSASSKQKLNMKNSKEAELVAIDDSMGQILWSRHFLVAQREHVPITTIYQDNKSTILLADNRKTSSSKRTRHLNFRYFFIMDKIKKGKVTYCPMQEMLGGLFTKPLEGTQFVWMRSKILNLPSSSSTAVHRSVLENDKDPSSNVKTTRSNTILKGNKAVIGGGDGNSKL